MPVGAWIGILVVSIIIALLTGAAVGFFLTKKMFEKQLRENPPITEKQIRAMYMQMGRKPSEAQIKATMRSVKRAK
ncbi:MULTISPECIES: YneF family protein [unclassified Mycoplasma]|uniref:YneF family protein n=1 Tax=unclassified Mycoplasma TaxID=2683645 RepID=UPI000FDF5434